MSRNRIRLKQRVTLKDFFGGGEKDFLDSEEGFEKIGQYPGMRGKTIFVYYVHSTEVVGVVEPFGFRQLHPVKWYKHLVKVVQECHNKYHPRIRIKLGGRVRLARKGKGGDAEDTIM